MGSGILKKLREAAGLSQAALAKLAKTSQPQIKRLEDGDRKLTREWAERLAAHLKTTPQTLMFSDLTVSLVGMVGASHEINFFGETNGRIGLARMPPGGGKETVAVEVTGDSLGPVFVGWLIYYDERREPPTTDLLGELCVVGLPGGQVYVKKLMRGRVDGHYDLWPAQGSPMTDQLVEWAAKVLALMPPWWAKAEIERDTETQNAGHRRKKPRRRTRASPK